MGRFITEAVLGSLCQSLSDEYMGETCSTHNSLRGPYAVRYARSSFATIIDVMVLIQMWSIGILEQRCYERFDDTVIIKAAYAERPSILLLNGILSYWTNLSALRFRTPWTGAILDGKVFNLLMRRHVWLESGNRTFCYGQELAMTNRN
jgi:hypothetical protein